MCVSLTFRKQDGLQGFIKKWSHSLHRSGSPYLCTASTTNKTDDYITQPSVVSPVGKYQCKNICYSLSHQNKRPWCIPLDIFIRDIQCYSFVMDVHGAIKLIDIFQTILQSYSNSLLFIDWLCRTDWESSPMLSSAWLSSVRNLWPNLFMQWSTRALYHPHPLQTEAWNQTNEMSLSYSWEIVARQSLTSVCLFSHTLRG